MTMKYEDFELTTEQIKACEAVKRAINKAKKVGVYILAKQDRLTGYSGKAFNRGLVAELHTYNQDRKYPVQNYSMGNIVDSGADDTEYFKEGVF